MCLILHDLTKGQSFAINLSLKPAERVKMSEDTILMSLCNEHHISVVAPANIKVFHFSKIQAHSNEFSFTVWIIDHPTTVPDELCYVDIDKFWGCYKVITRVPNSATE